MIIGERFLRAVIRTEVEFFAARRGRRAIAAAMLASATGLSLTNHALGASVYYTWDSSGLNPTAPVDGSGNWDTSTADWSNLNVDTTWPNATTDAAVFGSGNGTSNYTITLQTTINAGTITFNSAGTGTYTLTGGVITIPSTSITVNANVNAEIDSAFTGTGASLNIEGAAVLTLGGSSSFTSPIINIYPGATVSVPTINPSNTTTPIPGPLGDSSGGVRVYGGTIIATGSDPATSEQGIRFYDQGGTLVNSSSNGTINVNGATSNTGTQPGSLNITSRTIALTGNSVYSGTYSGTIVDSMPTTPSSHRDVTSLLKSGSGEWILGSGTNTSTYTGTTTVSSGTLGLAYTNELPVTTTVTLGTAGTNNVAALDLGPTSASEPITVAGLVSLGTDFTKDVIVNNDTHTNNIAVLTINPSNAASPIDSTFNGVMKNGATSKLALTKAGSNALTLSGTNTYTGATTITGGTLSISGSIASTAINVNASTGTVNPTLSLLSVSALSSNSTITVTTGSLTPTIYLDYNGNETVNSLSIGGLAAAAGVYSASNEPTGDATLFASDSPFAGTLTVAAPEPGSISLVAAASAASLLHRRRRRRLLAAAPTESLDCADICGVQI